MPLLVARRTSFKYLATETALHALNAGLFGYSQIGKCLVAYLGNGAGANALIPSLKTALVPFRSRCPVIPYARALGGGLPIYYRYGAYAGEEVTLDGVRQPDARDAGGRAVPRGFGDPFREWQEPTVADERLERFLSRHPVVEALSQGGKSGVFVALDLESETFSEVVLKVGYRHGQVMPGGVDGFDLLARERRFFSILKARHLAHLAPSLVRYEEFARVNVLVMERVEGADLLSLSRLGELAPAALGDCLSILQHMHRADLVLGDPKLANFVQEREGGVKVVDFESSSDARRDVGSTFWTFHLVNPSIADAREHDIIHFLVSVLYDYESDTPSIRHRSIDLRALGRTKVPGSRAERWALDELVRRLGSDRRRANERDLGRERRRVESPPAEPDG